VQVVAYYILGDKAGQLSPDAPSDMPNWWAALMGLLIVATIGINAPRWFKNKTV